MNVRDATLDDVQILAKHHKKMFQEIWEQKGLRIEINRAQELEFAYIDKISKQIPEGVCKAWVIENDDEILASGAITIVSFVPVPSDLGHNIAYLHSMYTKKTHRQKKCAQKIVDRAIQYCQENGISRMLLNASDAGKPIYEKAGFVSSPETMRLFIK
ncbi:MAG: GNAT family N-acetyltransferase [Proteobacteria bacterium]|nr:GNAT family N-acetyltransferase [Pseudomonadota bacterium]MBU1584029.1 GNAT family N-acetyltransferase [Pseudomonadota bacterium]MBU2455062.1 GNAT family N-acetyltransferase [Pseudomonadota bacterium]MBU2630887.1 GNAT family N-acetyltransferase [Pseudomonadota bacterium]